MEPKTKVLKRSEVSLGRLIDKETLYFGVNSGGLSIREEDRDTMFKHEVNFSMRQYCEFLIAHIVGLAILGPFMILYNFVLCFLCNRYLVINLLFFRFSKSFFIQLYLWISTVIIYYSYTQGQIVGDFNTVFLTILSVIIWSSSIASKYATYPKLHLQLIRSRYVNDKEIYEELMLGPWSSQGHTIMRTEVDYCAKRNSINRDLFLINFFVEPN